jgi:hypothetical protein
MFDGGVGAEHRPCSEMFAYNVAHAVPQKANAI